MIRSLALAFVLVLLPTSFAVPLPQPVPEVVPGFKASFLEHVTVPTALVFGPSDPGCTPCGPDLFATTLLGDVVRIDLSWEATGPLSHGVTTYATGFGLPLGLAFDGGVLYVADSHAGAESDRTDGRITRVNADGTQVVVVDGLPNGRHNTNHLRFGPDGRLYIANGNPNDAGCPPSGCVGGDPDVLPLSGAILSVSANQVSTSPAVLHWKDGSGNPIPPDQIATHGVNTDFNAKVDVLASGFRNVFGVAFSPAGTAYTAMNGADEPASQDPLFKIAPGTDYGFPFCYNVGVPGSTAVTVEANPLFAGHDCTGHAPATALLGWHVCATGLDFPTSGPAAFPPDFQDSVFIGECGPFFLPDLLLQTAAAPPSAWQHNTGHKVVRVVLDPFGDAIEVRDFLTGLALPTDVLFGPDGSLFVADVEGILRVSSLLPPVTVQAAANQFLPPSLVVPEGTTIQWNGALLPHTVTTSATPVDALTGVANDPANADGDPDTFRLNLPQGATVSHTFDAPGTFFYYCEQHYPLGMVGTVVVV